MASPPPGSGENGAFNDHSVKQKQADLVERPQQIAREQAEIQEERAGPRHMSYEPDDQASAVAGTECRDRSRKVKPLSSELKAAMSAVNKRQTVM
ncbi:hypothetical protein B5V01_22355 [Mesorhizobium erdmanii]|nr:hypothetical protein B5V01_22355 [Mesorhizobium erdmanii]